MVFFYAMRLLCLTGGPCQSKLLNSNSGARQ
jgi:hypothetical protein